MGYGDGVAAGGRECDGGYDEAEFGVFGWGGGGGAVCVVWGF